MQKCLAVCCTVVVFYFRPVEDVHIQFGRIEGMSSRRGTVVFLRDILDEARDRLLQSMNERKSRSFLFNSSLSLKKFFLFYLSLPSRLLLMYIIWSGVKVCDKYDYFFCFYF